MRPRRPLARPTKARPSSGELTHSADGIDLTLIRWMLSLTPAERLQVLQRHVQSVMRLRGQRSQA